MEYRFIRSLGKGGMGEVFLAHDALCERTVALKKIREDLSQNLSMQERFLREAKIAAQLSHPSIIPIYSISEKAPIHYTMPYVEGETLREIVKATREEEKAGQTLHPIGASIPTLARIFLNVCQAAAYAHSKKILHRDLKADNIIIGKYGEVLILDWGLAAWMDEQEKESEGEEEITSSPDLTRPGKVVGTLSHLAPERALGEPASVLTEIYSLGVILYQLLTLRLPFARTTLAHFRKQCRYEQLIDPSEAAPYRDIPRPLAEIAKKALSFSKEKRFQTVEELIAELENYIEGRPEWTEAKELRIDEKADWEFQENILLAKHIALTHETEVMEWVSLMVSRESFPGNIKFETRVKIKEGGQGIGFLLSIPEAKQRKSLEEGYCLWIGSELKKGCRLFRSNIEVLAAPDVALQKEKWHRIRIERIENRLRLFIDDQLILHYVSYLPLLGTHVGFLSRDADFEIEPLHLSTSSQNIMVNCLVVPDAFLACKDYERALSEYRRISISFPGRAEGREAAFRAGVAILQKALATSKKKEREELFLQALDEFGKLHATPGAPLEYLGKSLVYNSWGDIEEEVKCLELALRKYPKHPLLPILSEQILFRLHESSSRSRSAAYNFALLFLRHLPALFDNPDNQNLLTSLTKHWEPLPFLEPSGILARSDLEIALAFWLARPMTLIEIIFETKEDPRIQANARRALAELGFTSHIEKLPPLPHLLVEEQKLYLLLADRKWKQAKELLDHYKSKMPPLLEPLFACYVAGTKGKQAALQYYSKQEPASTPRSHDLLGHYLMGHIDLKKGWIDEAFFYEKVQLFRQLALFYKCLGKKKEAALFERKLKQEQKRLLALYPHA